jgi:maleate isomerase
MRTRVGLIVPSSNTVMEVDLYRSLESNVTVHTARMYLEATTPEGELKMLTEHLPGAIRDIATLKPHVVVFGCTSAGALRGNDYESQLISRIAEESSSKAISVIAAVRHAIVSRGARRVGVLTPYVDTLNERIRESLEADGLEVVGIHGLGIDDNFAIAAIDPSVIAARAYEHFADAEIDLLFTSCTNFRALDAVEQIEYELGLPVMTSNLAAIEAVREQIATQTVEDG